MTGDALSPADAFGLLADETRLAIVESLVDRTLQSMGEPVAFSDIRRAVGVDDAGKFNYHLGKLQPQFIQKTDDGYLPRFAALEAIRTARSGAITELPEERRGELPTPCPSCGDPLVGVHEGSRVTVRCDTHDTFFQSIVPPRTAAERSVQEVVEYASRETQRDIEKVVDGVCMLCGGPIESTVPDTSSSFDDGGHLVAGFDCQHCVYRLHIPVPVALTSHPAVVAHHWNNGVDIRYDPFFSPEFVDPEYTTLVSEDPFEAEVEVACGGQSIRLSVDGELNADVV